MKGESPGGMKNETLSEVCNLKLIDRTNWQCYLLVQDYLLTS